MKNIFACATLQALSGYSIKAVYALRVREASERYRVSRLFAQTKIPIADARGIFV